MTTHLLLIDDDPSLRECLELALASQPHQLIHAGSADEALQRIEEFPIDVAFVSLAVPGLDDRELLPQIAQRLPGATLIAVGLPGDAGPGEPVRGAYDTLATPIDPDALLPVLRRARERNALLRRNQLLHRDLRLATGDRPIIAASEPMIALLEEMERAAGFKASALLIGESGTGKEELARAIHAQSPRRNQPFVVLHCGATPERQLESRLFGHARDAGTRPGRARRGLLAEADGGTLFLDEVGAISGELQARLLELLQHEEFRAVGESKARRVDVRVIAASSRDLSADAAVGRFLPELHERLAAHRLCVPPLRARRKDIPLLFDHYLAHYRNRLGRAVHSIADDALERIVQYAWPGNLRELQNVVERAVLRVEGSRIVTRDLPSDLEETPLEPSSEAPSRGFALKPARKALEADMIRRALRATDGNRTHAAKLLDISHRALLYKIKEYGIRDLPPASKR